MQSLHRVEKSHAPNDKNAAPIPVISTEAKRSGEISFLPWYMKHGGRKSPAQSPPRAPHTGLLPARDDQGQPLTFMEPE